MFFSFLLYQEELRQQNKSLVSIKILEQNSPYCSSFVFCKN